MNGDQAPTSDSMTRDLQKEMEDLTTTVDSLLKATEGLLSKTEALYAHIETVLRVQAEQREEIDSLKTKIVALEIQPVRYRDKPEADQQT